MLLPLGTGIASECRSSAQQLRAGHSFRAWSIKGWRENRGLVFRRAILLILLAFLALSAAFAKTVHDRQQALAAKSRYDIIWAAARMAADLNRFAQAVAEVPLGGSEAGRSQLALRADIVKNRLSVMQDGEFSHFTKAIPAQGENLGKIVAEFERISRLARQSNVDSIRDLLEDVGELQTRVAELVGSARAYSGDEEQVQSAELINLHLKFLLIVGALIAFGCLALFAVNRQYVLMSRSHDELQAVTADLRQTTVSRQYLDAAINSMTQSLCMVDGSDRLIVWNNQFITLFCIPSRTVVDGVSFFELIRENSIGSTLASSLSGMIDTLQSRRTLETYSRFVQEFSDGRAIEVSQQRMEAGWLLAFEEITERRRAETERLEAMAEAEQARGRELVAQASNRAKSSFLAVMSHEIRTPMNAVLGLASTLMEDNLTDEQRATIGAIHNAGDDLLTVLNDILDYSKLDAGRLDFEAASFSPRAVAAHAVSIMGARASAKCLVLRSEIDLDVPEAVVGDAGRIRQVLLNLVGNAVKFTEAGEIMIGIRVIGHQDGQVTLEWSVSDTGIGIPPEQIGGLFTDFTQADSSINRRFGGTGLGLAICKRIVEQMGGEIGVSSSLDHGSTFRFRLTLPRADSVMQLETEKENSSDVLRVRIASLDRPLRVLVADDNKTNQLIVGRMLKEFDVNTIMAGNGVEAIDVACRLPVDMILMDMHMPEMDGLQATVALRARGGIFADMPIIAFTANAFADDVRACRDAGMSDFLSKPVRKEKLLSAILRALPGAVELTPTGSPMPESLSPRFDKIAEPSPNVERRRVLV